MVPWSNINLKTAIFASKVTKNESFRRILSDIYSNFEGQYDPEYPEW